MTPAARIEAAIGLLDRILAGEPAEAALTRWARSARYAGSKDRAALRDHVYQALRCRRSYACLGGAETGRGLMLGLLRAGGTEPDTLFNGERHAPAPLSEAERSGGRKPGTDGARLDLPDWLVPEFRASLGAQAEAAAQALRGRAPVMLRVNIRKSTVAQAIDLLEKDGIETETARIAPTALRVTCGARRVAGSVAYRTGVVELQDGSSQAAMHALDLSPGLRALDYCAGGGGKVLALAARLEGSWFAHDAAPGRMTDLPARAHRAGCTVTCLAPGGARAGAPYDFVLCDVPCSGSGTWRRAPDAKWRLTPAGLDALAAAQDRILRAAAKLVRPGGTLGYATCSVLHRENMERIKKFLSESKEWESILTRSWPISDEGDGFFVAQIRKNTR